nr:uncharacterized protein LOC4342477 isoform X3 [Oryza sativa Japonica Group]
MQCCCNLTLDPLADITNTNGLGFTNRRGKGRAKSLCVVRRNDEECHGSKENCDNSEQNTPIASNVHPIVTPNSQSFADDRDASFSTPSNLPMCTGAHGDVTNLTHAEVARKRARNWYTSLTQEQKDERNKKDHERRKRKKEESQVLKSATNSGVAPLGKLSNVSAADLMTCQLEVNDSSTLKNEVMLPILISHPDVSHLQSSTM